MKNFILTFLAAGCLFLAGCLENVQEVTLNEDGSGTMSTTNDMSALIGLIKQMGGAAELEKAGDQNMDSTFSLEKGAEKLTNLTAEEKEMLKKGTVALNINMKNEKMVTKLNFPFSSPSQIAQLNKLGAKVMGEVMKEQMKESAPIPQDQMPEQSSIDDYYKFEFSNGELTRKVNDSKYAGVESDEYLKSLKQATTMGLEVKSTYIFNLPRPASKVEGKNAKLSDDKKKVTVTGSLDDFFADAKTFEFKIKY